MQEIKDTPRCTSRQALTFPTYGQVATCPIAYPITLRIEILLPSPSKNSYLQLYLKFNKIITIKAEKCTKSCIYLKKVKAQQMFA